MDDAACIYSFSRAILPTLLQQAFIVANAANAIETLKILDKNLFSDTSFEL